MLKKIVLSIICFTIPFSFAGCNNEKADDTYPQLSPMKKGEQVAVMTTSMGVIKLRFFPQQAPKAVENFITHSKDGYYDGLIFHRVMNDFMIQSGDPKGDGTGGESIWGGKFELETDPNVRHLKGAVGMANSGPDSNGSQFYITQNGTPAEYVGWIEDGSPISMQEILNNQTTVIGKDENGADVTVADIYPAPLMEEYAKNGGAWFLDFGYTVFAQVYEGMDVVDAIAAVEVDDPESQSPKPVKDVVIESIVIEQYK